MSTQRKRLLGQISAARKKKASDACSEQQAKASSSVFKKLKTCKSPIHSGPLAKSLSLHYTLRQQASLSHAITNDTARVQQPQLTTRHACIYLVAAGCRVVCGLKHPTHTTQHPHEALLSLPLSHTLYPAGKSLHEQPRDAPPPRVSLGGPSARACTGSSGSAA